jgi:hypothetical protein
MYLDVQKIWICGGTLILCLWMKWTMSEDVEGKLPLHLSLDTSIIHTKRVTECSLIHTYLRTIYSRVSFCDGSFYDDSLLRPLSSRTEHCRLVVHRRRNSSVLSLLSALLALFRCVCFFSFYFSAVLLSWLWIFHPCRPSKRQEKKKIKTVDVTFFLGVFWTTAWAFFNKIKSDLIDIFFIYLSNVLYT